MMEPTTNNELELRVHAVELTVQHFMEKSVTEDAFMKHLERIYNFLKTGNT